MPRSRIGTVGAWAAIFGAWRARAPGRPVLSGTSAKFLEMFGLRSLRDLPELSEVAVLGEEHGTPVAEAMARGGLLEHEIGLGDGDGDEAEGLGERS